MSTYGGAKPFRGPFNPKRDYPLVEVLWEDAASCGGWDKAGVYREKYGTVPIRSAGYMISRAGGNVMKLVLSADNQGKVCDGLAIPKTCIRRVSIVRKAQRGRKP